MQALLISAVLLVVAFGSLLISFLALRRSQENQATADLSGRLDRVAHDLDDCKKARVEMRQELAQERRERRALEERVTQLLVENRELRMGPR